MTAANQAPELLLHYHLKKLRLPTVLREYEKLARHCATENVDHVRYLARLIELELIDREARMVDRRIKAARFGEERLTGVLLDRLTHHVHILEMNGKSYRLAQSRSKRKR